MWARNIIARERPPFAGPRPCAHGLWRLIDHFRVYDAAGFIAAATAKGLAALGAELHTLESADPECRRVPRVKPFDDASGLLLDISPE